MILVVTGDRNWSDGELIYDVLSVFEPWMDAVTVVHGAARGADTLAAEAAEKLGFYVVPIPADWEKHGKAAGPIRNREMLEQHPDFVFAFHDDLSNSKGTKDCVTEALRRGIPTTLVKHPDKEKA